MTVDLNHTDYDNSGREALIITTIIMLGLDQYINGTKRLARCKYGSLSLGYNYAIYHTYLLYLAPVQ